MTKKKITDIYEKPINLENIEKTWKVVKSTCKNRKAVYKFALNKNTNIYNIYNLLINKKYLPYKYTLFLIFEPKPRLVMSQSVADKVINHFVANYYLLPYLENKLIDSNVATRKKRGSKKAEELIIKYINELKKKNNEIYCLKLDISKYFYSINHNKLIKMLERDIHDQDVIDIIRNIISETNKPYINEKVKYYNEKFNIQIPYYENGTGLSIGAMTSQFLAIYYLNDLDHYIKEQLHCKYYIRYMDDFIIMDSDKAKLKEIWKNIEIEIKKLNLKINPKSTIVNLSNGLTFLGFRYFIENNRLKIKYRKKTIKKINKKLKILSIKDKMKYYKTYGSYYGYLKKVNKNCERSFKMKAKEKYDYFKEKRPKSIVIVKEGSFFKSYGEDAIILWHLFNYKWHNDSIAFGTTPYSKVISQLSHLGFSYSVISSEEEHVLGDNDEIYDLYLKIAKINYEKFQKKEEITTLFNEILELNNYYDTLKEFLISLKEGDDSHE